MNFLKKLSGVFATQPRHADTGASLLTVKCARCGEVIQTRLDLSNDLSADYDEAGNITTYFCRKVLIGQQRCFQQIEVTLKFDAHRRLLERQITGGEFVEA